MWTRKELKQLGRRNLRNNYWRILGVLLIVTFVVGGFHVNVDVGSNITGIKKATMQSYTHLSDGDSRFEGKSTEEVINNFVNGVNDSSETVEGDPAPEDVYDLAKEHYKPTTGVLAKFYNNVVDAKSFFIGILNGINEMAFNGRVSEGIIIIISAFIMLAIWLLLGTTFVIGECRYMLETRSYYDTKIGRVLFVWRVRSARNTIFVMGLMYLRLFLWCFTIIGGIIKYYSYRMIPYILAENPDMKYKEVFALSHSMMKGQKWNTFKLDISFIGWKMLSGFTFGILSWTFVSPYQKVVNAELYMNLRAYAKANNLTFSEMLFDEYLAVEPQDGTYPLEKYPLHPRVSSKFVPLEWDRKYSIQSYILIFFTFSFIGWLWEVGLHIVEDGVFVNRGTMFGPWLPIYGSGGVLVVALLKRFAKKPGLTFALAVVLCGILEYSTATFLWETKHTKWWDYSGYFLNLNGRICAEGLIVFGIGGMAFIYILAPFFDELFKKLPKKTLNIACVVLLLCFAADSVYSHFHPNTGAGITDYGTNDTYEIHQEVQYARLEEGVVQNEKYGV